MSFSKKYSLLSGNWGSIVTGAIIVSIAAVLRFYGLTWGLPDALHQASYHPDEFLIVGTALVVYAGQAVIPRFYNYPSLFIYLVTVAIMWVAGVNTNPTLGDVHLAARVVGALMGTAAVGVTFWSGWILYGISGGIIASLIMAVAPIHVQHSHFATVDVPSTLFTAAALGYAGLVLKRGSWRDYVLAGVMSGLAAGTKYNAGVVVLAVVAAHFLRQGFGWTALLNSRVWTAVGCMFAAFIVSTPGVILRFKDFWYGFSYELAHSARGHGLVFAGTGNGFTYTFTHSFWYGMGPWLAVLFMVSLVWALIKRDRTAFMLLALIVPYYAMISLSQVRFARYTIPMLPGIALLIAGFVYYWLQRFTGKVRVQSLVAVGVAGIIVFTALYTVSLDRLFTSQDPRDQAAQWITDHVQQGSSMGLIDAPWFYSPPLSPTFGAGSLTQREESIHSAPYDISLFSRSEKPGEWIKNPPMRVIISDYDVSDALRLERNGSIPSDIKQQVKRTVTDMKLVEKNYTVEKRFSGTLKRCWNHFGDVRDLPHDMRYPSPTITIYERRK